MALPLLALGSLAIGAGLQLFGASQQEKQAKKAAKASKRAARQQKEYADDQNDIINKKIKPLIEKQGEAQEKASAESRKAEELRRLQMRLDASRTRRDIIRQRTLYSSVAKTRAANQGASDSSSLLGSLSQITAEGNRQTSSLNQNLQIGEGIFSANIATSEFLSEANQFGTKINLAEAKLRTIQNKAGAAGAQATSRIGAISSQSPGALSMTLGGSILSALPSIDRLGTTALFGSSLPFTSGPNNGYFYDFAAGDPFYPVYE